MKTPKGCNKHHIIPKHAGGVDIPNNRKLMFIENHDELHYYDNRVPADIIKKDKEYYVWMYEFFNRSR